MVTIRTAPLIIRLLSITAVCTGLTIGGTAVGFLFGTATSARLFSIFADAVLSRAVARPSADLPTIDPCTQPRLFLVVGEMTVSARDAIIPSLAMRFRLWPKR